MSEWSNPAPVELVRKENRIGDIVESALTSAEEARYSEHLRQARLERIRAYQQKVANLATSQVVEIFDTSQVAAD